MPTKQSTRWLLLAVFAGLAVECRAQPVASLAERSISEHGGLYVRVNIWRNAASRDRGDVPHIESFHFFGVRPTRKTVELDASGHWKLLNGGTVDPATFSDENPPPPRSELVMIDVPFDVKAYVRRHVRRYALAIRWQQQSGLDRSDRRVRRSQTDRHGLLAATSDLSLSGL